MPDGRYSKSRLAKREQAHKGAGRGIAAPAGLDFPCQTFIGLRQCDRPLLSAADPRKSEDAAMMTLTAKDVLPEDGASGTLVGRVWLPQVGGPAVAAVRNDGLFDVGRVSHRERALRAGRSGAGAAPRSGASGSAIRQHPGQYAAQPTRPAEAVAARAGGPPGAEAAGVTFAVSMLERVIEERARGNPASAEAFEKRWCGWWATICPSSSPAPRRRCG